MEICGSLFRPPRSETYWRHIVRKTVINVVASVLILTFFLSSISAQEVPPAVIADQMYSVGDTRLVRVQVPDSGLIGSIGARVSGIPALFGATKEEDFSEHWIRVVVQDKYEVPEGIRIELRVDEIDKEVSPVSEEVLWHIFIEASKTGVSTHVSDLIRLPVTADRKLDFNDWGSIRSSMVDPLGFTASPFLIPDPTMKTQGRVEAYSVVDYARSSGEKASTGEIVKVDVLRKTAVVDPQIAGRHARKFYDAVNKETKDEPGTGRIESYLLWEETQFWGDKPDWLWERMERIDDKGNIHMRCEVVSEEHVNAVE